MADEAARTGFYPSRPSFLVEGEGNGELAYRLQSLLLEETMLGLFRCEARFLNWEGGFLFFDGKVIDFGKAFAVELGAADVAGPVFAGRITGIESQYPEGSPPQLLVLAEDRFQDLRMERRTRSFVNVSDADVIRRIASEHGLTAQVDVDGETHRILAQVNQSDLAFLRERAAAIDAQLWVDDRALYAQARSRRSSGTVSLTYQQNLLSFSVLADLAHQRTAVRVSGWDVGGKQAIDEEATVSVIAAELNGGRSGSAVLERALTSRTERVVSAVPLARTEARKMAEARYRERARRFLTGTGTADGNPKIRVGTTLDLRGLGAPFDGRYWVTLARQTFDPRIGYRTSFEVERPGIGG